jgi:hypothetical protein
VKRYKKKGVKETMRSSGQEFLAIDTEVRVRFPAPSDFLRSSGSGKGSTRLREYN